MQLQVTNLRKQIKGKSILKDVSFTLEAGQIGGLVGANGAGKTTLMKSILGMISINQGTIKVEQQVVSVQKKTALHNVGSLIEYPALYPYLTGWEHLRLFANDDYNQKETEDLIAALEMESYLKRPTRQYSLGMKQKLGILLALINQPRLVILDEPINGLDPNGTKQVRDLILRLQKRGITFLISSHVLSELEKMIDVLIIIKDGVILKQTTLRRFQHHSQQRLRITVDKFDLARKLIGANEQIEISDTALMVPVAELQTLVPGLNANGIHIQTVESERDDFENNLLQLLK
ncbi:ABC transporter ATP-binding protein [Fructilactobacillus carniphilus]|uniref:ATP-binding cassette domain-containing protein n=1 Tax=Fructilactobacillus carniphilus TaxID=2940297 RepID=A0ABY5BYS9_9LACO|nr:ATP-binding cassette domain-containing protein [Fructilactobacillus carniphilus]USS90256.1 ATP-binding cassette domain-containing protein [Fructilactobacillus carniphilus]